ncbi:hypothetical protein [Thermogymnomonas acidicola]|uniref:hypothetical protein n=1 Tax=Thermogymnomonas acidicola TaxID=399579 RepID=UPI001396B05E|nr:hypothetical protein [Thermogymnomonas acidicola]
MQGVDVRADLSRHPPGIRKYSEGGHVREGVGMGGAAYFIAKSSGLSDLEIMEEVDTLYSSMVP